MRRPIKLGLIAMSGIRAENPELMKLGLTLPAFLERAMTLFAMPSLSLLTLAGMTPDDIEIAYREYREFPQDDPPQCDLAAITSFSAQIEDAYRIADIYRQRGRARGTKVVMGGLHVSTLPEEALFTPMLSLFLIGVSLGGLIAANYVVHHPEGIEGLIAIAPALDASGVLTWRRMLLRGLSKVVPTLALKPGLHGNFLTRDQDALRKFTSDPLRQKKLTLRLASESIAAMTETLKMLPAMKLPLLVLHGAEDKIIPPVAGRMLHRLAGSADKEYHEYEGAYHVLTMEINREEVFEEISNWIARRTRRIVKGPSHESNETRAC